MLIFKLLKYQRHQFSPLSSCAFQRHKQQIQLQFSLLAISIYAHRESLPVVPLLAHSNKEKVTVSERFQTITHLYSNHHRAWRATSAHALNPPDRKGSRKDQIPQAFRCGGDVEFTFWRRFQVGWAADSAVSSSFFHTEVLFTRLSFLSCWIPKTPKQFNSSSCLFLTTLKTCRQLGHLTVRKRKERATTGKQAVSKRFQRAFENAVTPSPHPGS